MLTLSI